MRVLLSGLSNDRVELNLARALHEAGVNLFVLCVPNSPAAAWCAEHGILHQEQGFCSRVDRAAVRAYRSLLASHPFDVMHCLTNRALSTALLATRGWNDAPPIIAYRGTMGHLSRWDPAAWLSYLNPRVRRIICVSHAVRDYLLGMGIPKERLEVIWKGHDPAWYSAAPRSELEALGVPSDELAVSFTGNIRPVKGVDYLLEAFAGMAPDAGIHLLIFGEVRDRRIARQTGRLSHVHFGGYRADAARLAAACDLVVMPSIKREGLAKAVIESMAAGIPAVVTNVGGLPELVEDGISGRVVPPKDAGALLEAILDLAGNADKRRAYGEAAHARIAGPFHFSHTVRKTLELYRQICTDPDA